MAQTATGRGHLSSLQFPSVSSSSMRDVSYSCGSCGYELNLSSSSRNTSAIGSKYGKSIKKGFISFLHIDESRFTQVDEFKCTPYFVSRHSWGFFRRKTKLLCRNCGNYIGNTNTGNATSYPLVTDSSDFASSNEIPTQTTYDIRLRSLQPSSVNVCDSFAQ